MLKKIVFLFILFQDMALANLYFDTEYYQYKEKNPIKTKHHIFLNKPYEIRYWDRKYILNLTKINRDQFTIETETYDTKPLKYILLKGSVATVKMGKKYSIEEYSSDQKLKYQLKIIPEKVVETPN